MESLEGTIQYIVERFPSIGINNAILKYKVGIHIFQDMKFINLTNRYPEVKTVSLKAYGDMIQKENKELIDSYSFSFWNKDTDIIKDGKLAWTGFTHDYAISYCINKGYKTIVLVGAADFINGKHYATNEEFRYSEKLKRFSKRFIEDVCSKRASIVTCNANSFLEIPRINLEYFLK